MKQNENYHILWQVDFERQWHLAILVSRAGCIIFQLDAGRLTRIPLFHSLSSPHPAHSAGLNIEALCTMCSKKSINFTFELMRHYSNVLRHKYKNRAYLRNKVTYDVTCNLYQGLLF